MNLFQTLKCGVKRLIMSASDALAATKRWFHGNLDRIINQILACLRSIWQEWVAPVTRYIIDTMKKHPLATTIVIAIAIGAFFLFCPGGSIIILGALGFAAYGPVAGSVAAWIQGLIGNVSAGSFFAILQSAAMGGNGAMVFFGMQIASVMLVIPALALYTFNYASRRKQKTE
ncbi:integral component of membrane protein [Rutstroemia sp. NJR-2017a BVV2]|nr:integral component of membrane protein [Rutstroemia sp. NJR-2017a BVV2]